MTSLAAVKKYPKVSKENMRSFTNFLGNAQPLSTYDMSFVEDEMDFMAISPGDDYTVIEHLLERFFTLTGLCKYEVPIFDSAPWFLTLNTVALMILVPFHSFLLAR